MKSKPVPPLRSEEEKIAERLKKARLALRLTQAELAKKAGISRSAIVHYEKGNAVPGAIELIKLAKSLEHSPNYLLSGAETFFDSKKLEHALASENPEVTQMRATLCLMALDREVREPLSALLMALVKLQKKPSEFAEFVKAIENVAGTIAQYRPQIDAVADDAAKTFSARKGKR